MKPDDAGYALLHCSWCGNLKTVPWDTRQGTQCGACSLVGWVYVAELWCNNCDEEQGDHLKGYACLFAPTVFDPKGLLAEPAEVWKKRGEV